MTVAQDAPVLAEIRQLPVPGAQAEVSVHHDLASTRALISQARRQLAEAQPLSELRYTVEALGLAEDAGRRAAKLAEAMRLPRDLVEAASQAANEAAILRIEAQVKAGRLVSALQEKGALAQKGRPSKMSHGATFSEAGVDRREVRLWRRVAEIPDQVRQEYLTEAQASGGEVTTKGLLRFAARAKARTAGLDPALIAAKARRDVLRVHRGMVQMPAYRPDFLVTALSGGERRRLLATLPKVEAWIEDVRRELAIHHVVNEREG